MSENKESQNDFQVARKTIGEASSKLDDLTILMSKLSAGDAAKLNASFERITDQLAIIKGIFQDKQHAEADKPSKYKP